MKNKINLSPYKITAQLKRAHQLINNKLNNKRERSSPICALALFK